MERKIINAMNFLQHLFQFKTRLAVIAGILAGFIILSLVIAFLLNDATAPIIFWIGIMMSLLPLFIPDKPKSATTCKSIPK